VSQSTRRLIVAPGMYTQCGQPPDTWSLYLCADGQYRKQCAKCRELQKNPKKCLKCDKDFLPGCKAKFICAACMSSSERDVFEWNT
jgi:hypothetical protein